MRAATTAFAVVSEWWYRARSSNVEQFGDDIVGWRRIIEQMQQPVV
jgi:hypothetical protein